MHASYKQEENDTMFFLILKIPTNSQKNPDKNYFYIKIIFYPPTHFSAKKSKDQLFNFVWPKQYPCSRR